MARKKSCQYERLDGEPCPHPYFIPSKDKETGVDTDYCIFHAPLEAKEDKIREFWGAFDSYFNETKLKLEAARDDATGNIWFDCLGFIFPDTSGCLNSEFPFAVDFTTAQFTGVADFLRTTFSATAYFWFVTFSGPANFKEARFSADAYFRTARFSNDADFEETEFLNKADFQGVDFSVKANFRETKFYGNALFEKGHFRGDTIFERVVFSDFTSFGNTIFAGNTNFKEVEFRKRAAFWESRFKRKPVFINIKFEGYADFWDARFGGGAKFENTEFKDTALFRNVLFQGNTIFMNAIYHGDVSFKDADFKDETIFENGAFKQGVYFRDIKVRNYVKFKEIEFYSIAVFRKVLKYDKPKNIESDEYKKPIIYFEDSLFVKRRLTKVNGCDLSYWSFAGTNVDEIRFTKVTWPERGKCIQNFLTGGWGRKNIYDEDLAREKESDIDWEIAEQVYNRLRLNYENELEYAGAGDFHYGQLECRREVKKESVKIFFDWFEHKLISAYKHLFGYGESIVRPILWLISLFVIFGLRYGTDFTFRSFFSFGIPENVCTEQVIFSQLGRLIAVVFITFFILALRRRFKR